MSACLQPACGCLLASQLSWHACVPLPNNPTTHPVDAAAAPRGQRGCGRRQGQQQEQGTGPPGSRDEPRWLCRQPRQRRHAWGRLTPHVAHVHPPRSTPLWHGPPRFAERHQAGPAAWQARAPWGAQPTVPARAAAPTGRPISATPSGHALLQHLPAPLSAPLAVRASYAPLLPCSGSFGRVYRGRWRGASVAVKILSLLVDTSREAAPTPALLETMLRWGPPASRSSTLLAYVAGWPCASTPCASTSVAAGRPLDGLSAAEHGCQDGCVFCRVSVVLAIGCRLHAPRNALLPPRSKRLFHPNIVQTLDFAVQTKDEVRRGAGGLVTSTSAHPAQGPCQAVLPADEPPLP